jgi:hypothetical protein
MNSPLNLNLVADVEALTPPPEHGEPPAPEAKTPEPKIFVRSVSAPAGMPWSQARIAALEARLGAPLPLHEVVYQLQRLETWRWGQPARYATFYVRAREVGDALSTTIEVDGRPISVQFLSKAEQARRGRSLLIVALIAAGFAALLVAAITTALAARAASAERLADVEHLAMSRLKAAESEERLKEQTRALNAAGIEPHRMSDVFKDLNWASAAKSPAAHIQALHWDHGYLAVEVRGDAEPFAQTDRTIVKVAKPIRAGTWLWGITPTQPPPSPPALRVPAPENARQPVGRLPSSDYGDYGSTRP